MVFQSSAALVAILIHFIPGLAMSMALFSHKMGYLERGLFGMILGIMVLPIIAILEQVIFAIPLTAPLVLANASLVLLASAWAYFHQGGRLPSIKTMRWPEFQGIGHAIKTHRTVLVQSILLVILALSFYIRLAPAWDPTFYEFDPMYYEKLTERLVQNGQIDPFSSDAYFPEKSFQRFPPLTHYLTGSWYLLHDALTGNGYEKNSLILISQLYPPLVGALMAFVAFVFIRDEFNEYYGLVAAGLMAFTPQLVKKFAGGVAEQQPWGLFAALLVLTLVLMALNKNSYRLGIVAGITAVANMLASQQSIWPIIILAAFIGIQGILYYLADAFDAKKWKLLGLLTASVLLGNTVLAVYQDQYYTKLDAPIVMTLLAAYLLGSLLFAASHFVRLKEFSKRVAALGVIGVVGVVGLSFTPLLDLVVTTVLSQTRAAFARGSLGQTIAEEGRVFAELFAPSFGILNPPILLALATLVIALTACLVLARRGHVKSAASIALVSASFIFLNSSVNSAILTTAAWISNPAMQALARVFVDNQVFGFMLIALIATIASYLVAEPKNRTEAHLLAVLIIFPIAYIGLNKLKFIVHLAIALVLALPYILGQTQRLIEELNDWYHVFSNARTVRIGTLVILMLIGTGGVIAQGYTVGQSMQELTLTRLPSDWIKTYQWMQQNTSTSIRVMSWWDYGHWTNFLGDRDTVLSPNNFYPSFNQGVARAFVDGNLDDLHNRMVFHNATHILVDGDLIGKWGALVYLSGTCDRTNAPLCPETSEINRSTGPGQSTYEIEHYFENLAVAGNCPASVVGVPLPMLQSSLGVRYCLTNDEMIYMTSQGQMSNVSRKYKLAGRDPISQLDPDTAYLFAVGQNQFINVNPYYEPFGFHNSVFDAAFTRLFFFESLPGFKAVYRSPNNYVKIFEYTGRPTSSTESTAPTPKLTPASITPSSTTNASDENSTTSPQGNTSPNTTG